MARITQPPFQEGQTISATGLNTRYSEFNQPGGLNAANLRDSSIDLPQFDLTNAKFMMLNAAQRTQGKTDFYFTAPRVLASYTGATFPAVTPLLDGAGNPTPLGPLGWQIKAGEMLRVYWTLNVNPTGYATNNWRTNGNGFMPIPKTGGGNVVIGDWGHAWLAWLQWDITSAALTNWTEVYWQDRFNTQVAPGVYGDRLAETASTTVIPPWTDYANHVEDGAIHTGATSNAVGPRSVSGEYYHLGSNQQVTVWGLRVVLAGLAHAYHIGDNNYFVWDPAVGDAAITLQYTSGNLMALHHTVE